MPDKVDISESNSGNYAYVGGGVEHPAIVGVARAGTSTFGTATWVDGIYGSLFVNPDGGFSYRLDLNDPDTNALGKGQAGEDRFSYTYNENGILRTATFVVKVHGIDEPGQVVITGDETVRFDHSITVGLLERYVFVSEPAISLYLTDPAAREIVLTNYGSIRGTVESGWAAGVEVFAQNPGLATSGIVNYGRIESDAVTSGLGGLTANTYNFLSNFGVISAFADPTNPPIDPQARATGALSVINHGVIEAISPHGEAYGVDFAKTLVNAGLIYVRGGTDVHPVGIIGVNISAFGAVVDNAGIIQADKDGDAAATYGIVFFLDGTNPNYFGYVTNSGLIVADIAYWARATSAGGGMTSTYLVNSGQIEGNMHFDSGQNIVLNLAGGSVAGDFSFGWLSEILVNSGTISGKVDFGDGSDFYDGTGGSIFGNVSGGAGLDVLIGGSGAETFEGGDGADRLLGNGGADVLRGGADADVFVYSAVSDSTGGAIDAIADFETGVDRIDLSALPPSSITLSVQGGSTMLSAASSSGELRITVNGSVAMTDLILTGGAGQPIGTARSDILVAPGPGTLQGLAGNDVLMGSAGDDVLDGGSGSDIMRGGSGNDIYFVDSDGDRLIELHGEGVDLVLASVSYSLQAFTENLTLLGPQRIDGHGNSLDNLIVGTPEINIIHGYEGNDTIVGGGGLDYLFGGRGADRFVYNAVSDSTGDAPDELAYFETGIDVIDLTALGFISMSWTSYENPWSDGLWYDVLVETDEGTLKLRIMGEFAQSDFLLTPSTPPIEGTSDNDHLSGDARGNRIYGLEGNDVLRGLAGEDHLVGGRGDDLLYGGDGQDRLEGGPGSDSLFGEAGDDWLAGGTGADLLIGGPGIDTASYAEDDGSVFVNLSIGRGYANASFSDIYDGIENVVGTEFNDFLIGDPGVNLLEGAGGDDTVIGGVGADEIIGGAGEDWASYEDNSGVVFINLTLARGYNNAAEGDTYDGIENLIGGLMDDFFIGDENANRLSGAMGADTLLGAGGADIFMFTYAPEAESIWGHPNVDLILDFTTGVDTIELAASAFPGLAVGALPASAFYAGTAAHDADDRIIYDSATGKLFFDPDGAGAQAAMQFATLGESSHPAELAATDFVVV